MSEISESMDNGIVKVREAASRFIDNVGKVIVGKADVTELFFLALLCEGHVLVEDVPGIGKTMLAKSVAKSFGGTFKRIQSTPDLLPSDVTGIHYFNQKSCEFEFRPGPIIANLVLVDEINRATPRTQSCLLESMQERQITVDLETVSLPRPFLVIATQNPVESEGTFPLPEAQLDRFMFRITLGYPSGEEEEAILSRFQSADPLEGLSSVIEPRELLNLHDICRRVYVADAVRNYIVALATATRNHDGVRLGVSPRASLSLSLASQALAAVRGRDYVIPDDVKQLAVPALAHRMIPKTEARLRGHSAEDMVKELLQKVPVPVEETRR